MKKNYHLFVVLIVFGHWANASYAEQVFLKSGGRGELTLGVFTAAHRKGGAEAGNVLELKVSLQAGSQRPQLIDAKSLCHVHAQNSYKAIQAEPSLRQNLSELTNFDAPMVGVRVTFIETVVGGNTMGITYHLDMKGVEMCQVLKSLN